jgi:hypothetical protein
MPDLWTHYFFAKQLKYERRLEIELDDIYYLGAQGPDFLFYRAFEPWKKDKPGTDVAELFHQAGTDRLLGYVFKRRETANDMLADYLTGFLTHYALDATVHPMIGRLAEDGKQHKQLEMALDMKLYRDRRSGQSIRQASVAAEVAKQARLAEPIAQFYVDLAREVFDQEIDKQLFYDSYVDFRKFHRLTNLSCGLKQHLVEEILTRFAPDYSHYFYGEDVSRVEISPDVWQEYKDKIQHAGRLFDLLDRSLLPPQVVNFSGDNLETNS